MLLGEKQPMAGWHSVVHADSVNYITLLAQFPILYFKSALGGVNKPLPLTCWGLWAGVQGH